MSDKPVFFDASGRRAVGAAVVGWTAAVISLVLGGVFAASLVAVPQATQLRLPGRLTAVTTQNLEKKALAPGLLRAAARLASEAQTRRKERARLRLEREQRNLPTRVLSSMLLPQADRPLAIAFYPNWEASAALSLKNALPKLDWLMPTWLALQGPNLNLKMVPDPRLLTEVRSTKPNLVILPVLQNATLGKWDGPGLARLLADKSRSDELLQKLVAFVSAYKLQGLTVDFEEVPPEAHNDLAAFLKQLSSAFVPRGWLVVMAVPFDDNNWPYATYAQLVDYTLLMAYDEHDNSSEAGSIAGQSWYETTLDRRMRVLSPGRTIVSIGSYAYDWNSGHADNLTIEDALVAAHDSEARITFDDATNNPHFSYIEDDQTKHDVWFLDAATGYNEIHSADIYRPAGYALWRLGSEDPSIWTVMGRKYGESAPAAIRAIPISADIDYEGEGDFLRVEAEPQSGSRTIEVDPVSGDIADETYTKIPTNYVIRQYGTGVKKLALTFDDGPDPEWTPQVLDILKAKHVHATFFVIGANAQANPDLIQRIVAEGHELGSHTYTHPNLADTPQQVVSLELNATQRLIEALTGRSMRLFRPPYLGDNEPGDPGDILPVEIAQNMGYLTVGERVDPIDWALPGPDVIVQRTLAAVARTGGNGETILLHDAGGDRSQTVAALPMMIDKLRAQGFVFVPASQLAGLTPEQSMPSLPASIALLNDRIVFLVMSWAARFLYYAFIAAIWLGISRLLFLAGLSLWNARRESEQSVAAPADARHVSVIVPAYNEEKVIGSTVERLLESDHSDLEIIVVDDGSQDRTSEVVHNRFGNDPRVVLLRVPNGGKANALNAGLKLARGEIIVALDADTQFQIDTIARLVRWFADENVGAVAGNAKVGNRTNMITRWQALEYVVAQNLERRALAALGTLTVIPGAVGAWRRSALERAGGFRSDTLAEDQELTIGLQEKGYQVRFDSSAIAWTEAPASFRALAKQRFRWAYGTLQCLWKYRRLTFNPRFGALGMIALPQVWMFQIGLTALAPLADLLLIWQLFSQWIAYSQHGAEFSNTDLITVGIYYIVFVIVDLLAATFGFLMERHEQWSLLWWLPLQRFGYRQLMYYVVVRSISTAIRGGFVGWGKLERTGTVKVAH